MKISRHSLLVFAIFLMIGMVLAGVGYNLLVVPKTRHVEIDQSVMEQEQWKKIDKKGQVIGVAGPNLADWTGWLNTHESGEIRIRTDEKGRELKVRLYPWSYALSRIEVTSGKLHGFVDNSGKTVIEPIYEQVHPFYNGLAEVKRTSDSPWEIVEPTGRTVVTIDQAYEPFICGRSEGVSSDGLLLIRMARAFSDPSCYVLNIRNNQIAYLGSVDELSQFSEGVARFSSKRKSGFVNAKGELVVAPIYDFVKQFHEGLTMVLLNGQYSYIDKTGKKVISLPADCSAAGDFHEGMAAVALGGDSRDKNDPSFLSVRKNAKWSFIDNKGRTIIGAKFHVERDPNNGLVVETPEFSEGLCKVTITENNKLQTGFIDPIGNWVVPPKYSEASNFMNGTAKVCVGAVGFTRPKWIGRKIQNYYSRLDLFNQFLRQFGLIGMTKYQVRQILGKPELVGHGLIIDGIRTSPNADADIYYLVSSFCGNGCLNVQIRYINEIAAAYKYTNDLDEDSGWLSDVKQDRRFQP